MAAVPSSVPSSVPPSVTSVWLTVDSTAAERGFVPAKIGQGGEVNNPVPGPDTSSPVSNGVPKVPDAQTGGFADWGQNGPWAPLPEGSDTPLRQRPAYRGQSATTTQGVDAVPDPGPPPVIHGAWSNESDYQTYDRISNSYDAQGFTNNVPNNRSFGMWGPAYGQSNPLNNPTWMNVRENPVQAPLANTGTAVNTYDNASIAGYQINNGGFPDLWVPDGSDVAYETPPPPPTSDTSSVSQASGDPAEGYW